MNSERVEGAVQEGADSVKEAAGKAVSNKELQAEGMTDKAAGLAKETAGKAKEAVRKATH